MAACQEEGRAAGSEGTMLTEQRFQKGYRSSYLEVGVKNKSIKPHASTVGWRVLGRRWSQLESTAREVLPHGRAGFQLEQRWRGYSSRAWGSGRYCWWLPVSLRSAVEAFQEREGDPGTSESEECEKPRLLAVAFWGIPSSSIVPVYSLTCETSCILLLTGHGVVPLTSGLFQASRQQHAMLEGSRAHSCSSLSLPPGLCPVKTVDFGAVTWRKPHILTDCVGLALSASVGSAEEQAREEGQLALQPGARFPKLMRCAYQL